MSVAWVGAGIAAAGVISNVVSSNRAANVQQQAAQQGITAQQEAGAADRALQERMYNQTRTDQLAQIAQTREDQLGQIALSRADAAPYRAAGTTALEQLRTGTLPGGTLDQTYQRGAFEADPGYQFRLAEGEQAVQRAAGARGGVYSGATLKALSRFNQGLASQEYGAYDTREGNAENRFNLNRDYRRNNLATLAGIGQTATRDTTQAGATGTGAIGAAGATGTGAIGSAGQFAAGQMGNSYTNQGNQVANLLGGIGEARASGYIGTGNAITSGLSQLYNGLQQNQFLSRPPVRDPVPMTLTPVGSASDNAAYTSSQLAQMVGY